MALSATVTMRSVGAAPAALTTRRTQARKSRTSMMAEGTATAVEASKFAGKSDYWGQTTVQGTSRSENQDRYKSTVINKGGLIAAFGVYDGHGGSAVAEYLADNLIGEVTKSWQGLAGAKDAISAVFLETDKFLLQRPDEGFFGMFQERGYGGSKCGSTAATAILVEDEKTGGTKIVSSNLGDARVVIIRDGKAVQLSKDHVPDEEDERKRIEYFNPNPKQPLVRFVGDCWRVGGIIALSRAFGDAYMKTAAEFEGTSFGVSDYASGFGLIAEPDVCVDEVTPADSWLIVASDGLNSNVERGGGEGLSNDEVAEAVVAMGAASPDEIASALTKKAADAGSTDDITVIAVKLN